MIWLVTILLASSIASSADPIARQVATDPGVQTVETEADILLHIELQKQRIRAGDVDEVIEFYRKLSQGHPGEGRYIYLFARLNRDDPSRLALLLEAVEQTPGMFYAERDLGRELYTSGAYREAVEHLTRALSANPNSARSRYLRGLAFYHRGEVKRAITDFETTIDVDPTHAAAYAELAVALMHDNRLDRAIEVMNNALQRFPDSKNRHFLHRNLGIAYGRSGKAKESRASYKQAIDKDPTYYDGHVSLGKDYYTDGELHRAAEQFQEALSLRPESGTAALQLGIVRFELDDLATSTRLLENAIKADSTLTDAYLYLSWAFGKQGNSKRAREFLLKHHQTR